MIGQAKVIGSLLALGGLVLLLGFGGWLLAARADGSLGAGGLALGGFLALLVVVPLIGGGLYLVVRGRGEVAEYAEAAKTKRLLNMVLTQGKVRVAEAVVELGLPREEVRRMVYDAVGRGLFSGYINWSEGVLYASEAAQGQQKCPNCGGTIQIAGKGVFQCPYCGTEIFLAIGEAGRHAIQGVTPPAAQTPPPAAAEPPVPATEFPAGAAVTMPPASGEPPRG
jgi:DNA-directed RNA polymerase subunit RPC12/RpoP